MVQRLVWLAASTIAPTRTRDVPLAFPVGAVRPWIVRHREAIWIGFLLLVVALVHGINMGHFPYFEDDEGTYMAQAWAVVHMGQLAPYTYWYDHAPLGWIQIALWTVVTGGFHTFGNTVDSGRMFMLALEVGAAYMVYRIGRAISGSVMVATVALLLFSLSAYGIYFQRRVLLDNIATFWMLLSVLILLRDRISLRRVWLSAVALGISVLSKEVTAFVIPVVAYLVYCRSHKSHRLFATIGWVVLVGSILSLYPLMAILKDELWPTGSLLGGTSAHVSLLGSLQYQALRGGGGSLFDPHSAFWQLMQQWLQMEPWLVIGGTACALFSVLLIRRHRTIGIMGLMTFAVWAFLARGGEVIEFYLIPLIPLLALNVALVGGLAYRALLRLLERYHLATRGAALALAPAVAAVCLVGIAGGYWSNDKGFAGNHLLAWQSTQSDAQDQAVAWIDRHLPTRATIVTDMYLWTDLHDGYNGAPAYKDAEYYWKVGPDPAVTKQVFHNTWRTIDYIVATGQLKVDVGDQPSLSLVQQALNHATVLAHFDTGGWPVWVMRVHAQPAARPPSPGSDRTAPLSAAVANTCAPACVTPAMVERSAGALLHKGATAYRPKPLYWFDACVRNCAGVRS